MRGGGGGGPTAALESSCAATLEHSRHSCINWRAGGLQRALCQAPTLCYMPPPSGGQGNASSCLVRPHLFVCAAAKHTLHDAHTPLPAPAAW